MECSIDGCTNPTGVPGTARGLCSKHYSRLRTHGDPLITKKVVGPWEPVCRICGQTKEPDAFEIRKQTGTRRRECRACRKEQAKAWQVKNREHLRAYQARWSRDPAVRERTAINHLVRRYGLTEQEAVAFRNARECQLCGASDQRLHVDHCHITGRVRGALCGRCNRALGMFGDDPLRLEEAAAYLRA